MIKKRGYLLLTLFLLIFTQSMAFGGDELRWEYNLDMNQEGPWYPFSDDLVKEVDPFDWIWFRVNLPETNIWGDKAKMIFPSYDKDFQIYIDGRKIYTSYDEFDKGKRVFIERYHLVHLPDDFPGKEAYFKVNMRHGPVGFTMYNFAFTHLSINTLEGFSYQLLVEHYPLIITLILSIFFGISMIFASTLFLWKEKNQIEFRKLLFIVGLLFLFFSLAIFSNQNLRFFLRDGVLLWHYSSFLFFVVPSLFIYFIRHLVIKSQIFPPIIPRIQRIIIQAVLGYAAIVFLLDLFKVMPFYALYRLTTAFYVLFMLSNLALIFYGSRKGDIRCTILIKGLQIAIMMGIIQSIAILIGRPGAFRVNRWSNFFLVTAIFFTLVYDFFETFFHLEPRFASNKKAEEESTLKRPS